MAKWLSIAVAAVCGVAAVWLGVYSRGQRQTIDRLEGELRQARSAAEARRPQASSTPAPVQPRATEDRPHRTFESSANPEADLLRARLKETKASLDAMTAQVQQLQAQVRQLADERTKLSAADAEMRTQLEELNHTVTAVSTERAALGKRVADVEAANAKLRAAASDSSNRNAELARFASDLEDITRRQEVYIRNILRRYRDVTELFRAFPAVVENRGNGAEISRIQSALQMADEDFRQLNDLNARLTRLQRQLTTAVAKK